MGQIQAEGPSAKLLVIFQKCQGHECQEKIEEPFLAEGEGAGQLSAVHDSELDPFL